MILIGLGSNVEGPWGSPEQTVSAALERLDGTATTLIAASRLLSSKPMGPIDQPDFINAVAIITTELNPEKLMQHLHDLELAADRRRTVRWGPRTLDLDLLDFNGLIRQGDGNSSGHQKPLTLPHPGIAERVFVLLPIQEMAASWQHPVTGKTATEMLEDLNPDPTGYAFLPTTD